MNELTDTITRLKQDLAEREKHYHSLLRQKDEYIESLRDQLKLQAEHHESMMDSKIELIEDLRARLSNELKRGMRS